MNRKKNKEKQFIKKQTMSEEVIKKALDLLAEGKFEESQNILLENINLFSKEAQIEILSSIIEAKLRNQISYFQEINLLLEKTLKDLQQQNQS